MRAVTRNNSAQDTSGTGFDRILVNGRWLVLLAVALTLTLGPSVTAEFRDVVIVLTVGIIYNAILQIVVLKGVLSPRVRNATVVIDLLIVSALVGLSGNIRSHFFDIFYLVLIAAGIQRGISGGLSAALASVVLVLVFELFSENGGLQLSDIDHLLSTIPYLLLVGLASGFLSRQLADEADRRRQAELKSQELALEQERARSEMELARNVQSALLPTRMPPVPYVELDARTVPARDIGGDLYDFDYSPNGSLTASIIDVSGKGVPAALALSGIKSNLDAGRTLDLPDLLSTLNVYMLEHTPEEMFVTMAVCKFLPGENGMQVASAGHEAVIVVRASSGATEIIHPKGLPLGVTKEADWPVVEVELEQGDAVLMYTDGVTDARCQGKAIEMETVMAIGKQFVSRGAHGIVKAIFAKLENECIMVDDATVVSLIWKG